MAMNLLNEDAFNQWAKSLNYLTIDPEKNYSLVSNGYDSRHFDAILQNLFGTKYPDVPYSTTMSVRDTFAAFISTDFKCSAVDV
jgi:hypothetical protein